MPNRKVLVAGATGLVGSHILQRLLQDDTVSEVHLLSRRDLTFQHPKLHLLRVDFSHLPKLPQLDEIYLALGTTIKQAGSRQAFEAIDLDANLAVANAGLAAGAKRIGLVSAIGANVDSMLFYNRIKGELEAELSTLPFDTLVIARPSFLLGDRAALNQPQRRAEKLGIAMFKLFAPLLPKNLCAVQAAQVATCLVTLVPVVSGEKVILSGDIQHY
jgi:uncharacterized protein YbjT (DUF2867 family)